MAHQKPPESLDVWGRYQRALADFYTSTRDGLTSAVEQCDQINELAPKFAPAYAVGSDARCRYIIHFGDPADYLKVAEAKARTAVALEPSSALCVNALARVYSYLGLHDMAIAKAEEAVALNTNYAFATYSLGFFLFRAERFKEAIAQLERAIRLSPRDIFSSGFWGICGISLFCLGQYEEAAARMLRSCDAPNPRPGTILWAAAALQKAGRGQEARVLISNHLLTSPSETITTFCTHLLESLPQVHATLDDVHMALSDAGMPE